MHPPMRDALVAIASTNGSDPGGFLEDLSDVHFDWHTEFTRTYGFLLFHHRVVGFFQSIVNGPLQLGIAPYADGDFQGMGIQPFDAGLATDVDTLEELAAFSSTLESWHNTTHGGLATQTGTPMMDPRRNIFFVAFWRLHLYIDALFEQVLTQYGNRVHPGQFVIDEAVASHVEVAHHGWVPRI